MLYSQHITQATGEEDIPGFAIKEGTFQALPRSACHSIETL